MYLFPFPSLSSPEGPVNQADKPDRFLLPLPALLKAPGHQTNYSLSCWPWRSQAHSQPCAVDNPSHNSPQNQPSPKWGMWTLTAAGHWDLWPCPSDKGHLHCCLLPPRNEGMTPILWLSVDYDCYIDTANHVLRFDTTCRGLRWLETLSCTVNAVLHYLQTVLHWFCF